MKKRNHLRYIAFALLFTLLLGLGLTPAAAAGCSGEGVRPVDVGNFNDYDSGGSSDWGGGSDWSSSDWGSSSGSDWDWTDDSSGWGGFFLPLGVVVVVIILIAVFGKKKGGGRPSANMGGVPMVADNTQRILDAILPVDPLFSKDKFLAWAKEVFITLQNAWTARDWSKIRPFEKEELFRQHEMQLQEYIKAGRINVMERININEAYLHKYERFPEYEYMTVYMKTRMVDYIIDEKTKKVLKGDPNRDCHMAYLLTFMRGTGVKTDPATSNKSTVACPHCGAPTEITSAGKCEYCGHIITTGEFDWVLCNMQAVKPGVPIDNSGVTIQDGQPGGDDSAPNA